MNQGQPELFKIRESRLLAGCFGKIAGTLHWQNRKESKRVVFLRVNPENPGGIAHFFNIRHALMFFAWLLLSFDPANNTTHDQKQNQQLHQHD
jgi:hypothetical protein